MALNSIINPWIYLSLNRDLRLSLCYCFCPYLQSAENSDTNLKANLLYTGTTRTLFHDPRFGANICFAGSRRYISSSATTQQALSSNVPKQPSMNLLRPRSFTASQAQAATNSRSPTLAQGGGLLQQGLFLPHHRHQCQLKKRPFSNHSYSRAPRETTEIPLMRCRLNTFQL